MHSTNMKHLLLTFLMFVAVTSGVSAADAPAMKPKGVIKRVDVEQFDQLRTNANAVVLDVRTEKEFRAGHIPGAVLLDISAPEFEQKVASLDESKTYLVHCGAGVRSARACQKLERAGVAAVYDLAPGFKGWQKAGKPIAK
jgi:phage shock protein E